VPAKELESKDRCDLFLFFQWQVKLCDSLLTHAIPECVRGKSLMMKSYTDLPFILCNQVSGTQIYIKYFLDHG